MRDARSFSYGFRSKAPAALAAGLALLASLPMLPAGLSASVSSIAVAPGDAALDVGQTQQYVAIGTLSDGSSRALGAGEVRVIPAAPSAEAGGATWIAVHTPFLGDVNANSHTEYHYASSADGPWTSACGTGIPGEAAWRRCTVGGLAAGGEYYVRVTFVDPDGVVGDASRVLGPIRTPDVSEARTVVGSVSVTVEETHLLVAVPTTGDANMNGRLERVELATSSGGPFVAKCGPVASFAPKLCRIVGLTQGMDYFVRVTVADPDGAVGENPQLIGPIPYMGPTDLAVGKPITADRGWGCCSDPSHLVDGRIQNPAWFYGFAWAGGSSCWAGGCPAGFKHATIDLGSVQPVGRLAWWTHDPGNVPTTWRVLVSSDGAAFEEVFYTDEPRCRTAEKHLETSWAFPSCGHVASFGPVEARYVRYSFDDRTLFGGIHGWAVEIEIYATPAPPAGEIVWSTSDAHVATIDADGLVTALAPGTATLTATSRADPGVRGSAMLHVRNPVATVMVDIKPDSGTNSVNPSSKGTVPVAVLTTRAGEGDGVDFDATAVDVSTVRFGPAEARAMHPAGHREDVDGDGDLDLVLHFRTQQTGIACGATEATLVGMTTGGAAFTGTDAVRTVGC